MSDADLQTVLPCCPQCRASDRVEYVRPAGDWLPGGVAPWFSPLACFWCNRCCGWLSALPALAPEGADLREGGNA